VKKIIATFAISMALTGAAWGASQDPGRLHRDVGLRLGPWWRSMKASSKSTGLEVEMTPIGNQLEHPGGDPLELDPDRRTDLDRVPAGPLMAGWISSRLPAPR